MRISRLIYCHASSRNLSDLGTAFIAYIRPIHRIRIGRVYRDCTGTIHLATIRIAPMGEIVLHAPSMAPIFIQIPTVTNIAEILLILAIVTAWQRFIASLTTNGSRLSRISASIIANWSGGTATAIVALPAE